MQFELVRIIDIGQKKIVDDCGEVEFLITNCKYKKPTKNDRYFSFIAISRGKAYDCNNVNKFVTLNFLASILQIERDFLYEKLLQYKATANINGGNCFDSLENATKFYQEIIYPILIALKLSNNQLELKI